MWIQPVPDDDEHQTLEKASLPSDNDGKISSEQFQCQSPGDKVSRLFSGVFHPEKALNSIGFETQSYFLVFSIFKK